MASPDDQGIPAKRASMAFLEMPDDGTPPPKVTARVLMQTKALGEVFYFLEVTCETDGIKGHFLRTYEDMVALDKRVRESGSQGWQGGQIYGERVAMKDILELPKAEKFGFRRRVSQMGLTDYNSERSKKLEEYLNSMLAQLPRLREEPIFAEWFGDNAVIEIGREKSAIKKLQVLHRHLAVQFTPRTPEECAAEAIYNLGATVRVVGLQNTTEFNNMVGVVQSFEVDEDKVRKSTSDGASALETSTLQAGSYMLDMVDGQKARAKAVNVRAVGKELTDADLEAVVKAEARSPKGGASPKRAAGDAPFTLPTKP